MVSDCCCSHDPSRSLSLSFFPCLSVLPFLPPPHLSLSLSDLSFRQLWFQSSSPGVSQLRDLLRGVLAMCPPPCPCLAFLICTVGSVPGVRVLQGFLCLQRLLSIQQVLPQRELPDGDGDRDRNHRTPGASRPPATLLLALHHCQLPAPCYFSSRASQEVNSSFSPGYLALSESPLPLPSLWGNSRGRRGHLRLLLIKGAPRNGRGGLVPAGLGPGSAYFQISSEVLGWV